MAAGRRSRLLETGAKAPAFELPAQEGGTVSLAQVAESGPALLAFYKVSCPVCQMTLPFLDRLHASGNLPVFGISQNNSGDTLEFCGQYSLHFPQLCDPEEDGFATSNAFGISSVPTLFLIERDGTISRVIEGWSRRDIEELGRLAGMSAVRAGERVPEFKPG